MQISKSTHLGISPNFKLTGHEDRGKQLFKWEKIKYFLSIFSKEKKKM